MQKQIVRNKCTFMMFQYHAFIHMFWCLS